MESARLRAAAEQVSGHLPGLVLAAQHLAATVAAGQHGLRRPGTGEDFWQYRPAHPGDSLRSIDWRRSARSDAQFVRDREVQSAQSVALWVSGGRGMGWSGAAGRPTKLQRANVLALALAIVLIRGGERAGLLGDAIRGGRAQPERIAAGLTAAPVAAGDDDTPDVAALRPSQRVVLFSDFLAPPDWLPDFLAKAVDLRVRGLLFQVLDPAEAEFPFSGAVRFSSPAGNVRHDSRNAGDLRDAYLSRLAERRGWLRAQAGAAGWQFGCHHTDQPPALALNRMFNALEG